MRDFEFITKPDYVRFELEYVIRCIFSKIITAARYSATAQLENG